MKSLILITFFTFLLNYNTIQCIKLNAIYDKNDETDGAINSLKEASELNSAPLPPRAEYFSTTNEKVNRLEVEKALFDLTRPDYKAEKAEKKLINLADVLDGEDGVKDSTLDKTLRVLMMNKFMKERNRVLAAKVASRVGKLPVSIQMTEPFSNKPKNYDAHIVMPRYNTLFAADKAIEHYKAGDWDI